MINTAGSGLAAREKVKKCSDPPLLGKIKPVREGGNCKGQHERGKCRKDCVIIFHQRKSKYRHGFHGAKNAFIGEGIPLGRFGASVKSEKKKRTRYGIKGVRRKIM